MEETGVPGENQTTTASPSMGFEFINLVVIGTNCTGSCIPNYQTITTTTARYNSEVLSCQ